MNQKTVKIVSAILLVIMLISSLSAIIFYII